MIAHRQSGSWRNLERAALDIIADMRQRIDLAFDPRLGGRTRLLWALDHRTSHDINLLIRDPQWIGYLSPHALKLWNDIAAPEKPILSEISGWVRASGALRAGR